MNNLKEIFESIPTKDDVEITIVRAMGDKHTFNNYTMQINEDSLTYSINGKQYKTLYQNIINIKWKPITNTNIGVIEAEYNKKKD